MKRIEVGGRIVETGYDGDVFSSAEDARLIDPILTQITQEFRGADHIWRLLFPEIAVPKRSFKYYEFGLEAFADTRASALRVAGTEAEAVTRGYTPHSGETIDRWLSTVIDFVEAEEADAPVSDLVNERNEAEFLADLADMWVELDAAETAMDADEFAADDKTDVTTGDGEPWTDTTDGAPLDDITGAIEDMLVRPNTLVMTKDAYWAALRHPQFRTEHATRSIITPEELKAILAPWGIKNILAGDSPVFDPTDGAIGNAWGTGKALLCRVPEAGSMGNKKRPAFGYTFVRQGYPKAIVIRKDEIAASKPRIWTCRKPIVVGRTAAHLLTGCTG